MAGVPGTAVQTRQIRVQDLFNERQTQQNVGPQNQVQRNFSGNRINAQLNGGMNVRNTGRRQQINQENANLRNTLGITGALSRNTNQRVRQINLNQGEINQGNRRITVNRNEDVTQPTGGTRFQRLRERIELLRNQRNVLNQNVLQNQVPRIGRNEVSGIQTLTQRGWENNVRLQNQIFDMSTMMSRQRNVGVQLPAAGRNVDTSA